jgi:hypothetical protein
MASIDTAQLDLLSVASPCEIGTSRTDEDLADQATEGVVDCDAVTHA